MPMAFPIDDPLERSL